MPTFQLHILFASSRR